MNSLFDLLIPVITLCICFDKKKWDAPRSLYDMFGEIDPRLADYINDYKLNLITPDEIEDFSKFASELGAVMESIKVSDDKEKVHDIIKTRKNGIISDRTADMIRTFAGTNLVEKKKTGGNIMISTGMQELLEDMKTEGRVEGESIGMTKGITKGRIEGRVLARYEDGMSIEDIAAKCKISVEKVKEIIASSTVTT